MLEPLLAYLHIAAFLGMAVFLTSEAALARSEWLNAAIVQRLVRVDTLYWAMIAVVLATGLARMVWGAKGWDWAATHPLLHAKVTVFAVMAALSWPNTRRLRDWSHRLAAGGGLPGDDEIRRLRRRVMWVSHLMLLVPLAAVFLARGWTWR
jgi:putative membrane protein